MTDHLQSIKKSFSDLGIDLKVGTDESNLGACTGEWIVAEDMHELVSYNPADGQPIASIIQVRVVLGFATASPSLVRM